MKQKKVKKQKLLDLRTEYNPYDLSDDDDDMYDTLLKQMRRRKSAYEKLEELCKTKEYNGLKIERIVHFDFIESYRCVVLVDLYDDEICKTD